MFYNDAFKSSYATGTAITWEIICPPVPGGNVSDFLYITATNRTAKAWRPCGLPWPGEFLVRNLRLGQAGRLPFPAADSSFPTWAVSGKPRRCMASLCPVIAVMNTTYQQVRVHGLMKFASWMWAPGNGISSFSSSTQPHCRIKLAIGWEAGALLLKPSKTPMLEPIPMGALSTQLISRDAAGNWGQWSQLTNTQSQLRTDNKGMVPLFVDPNFSWAVHS